MKLNNINGCASIKEYVNLKLDSFAKEEKTFENLFQYMFSESENVMSEVTDGYRIKKVTYAQCKTSIIQKAKILKNKLKDLKPQSLIGLAMNNSLEWIELFWCILMCGHNPVLINLRLSENTINQIIKDYDIKAIISDEKEYLVRTLKAKEIAEDNSIETKEDFKNWGSEVIFMSSGTTNKIKLCSYSAENFYYQICNSGEIVIKCKAISKHYEGELKQLVLLPFYHVFGFIAVYLWFGFFSRTFVFLKDLNPQTIQFTIKKHKVTHIFAVPLVWETIYNSALKIIESKGETTFNKFKKGLKLANSSLIGQKITHKAMSEVRDNLFGESVCCMISGGGKISTKVLEFFNGIGYNLTNGYGMTEVGITSVEMSNKSKMRNRASIGKPFSCTQYKVNNKNELLIKGRNIASKIMQNGEVKLIDYDEWFNSYDIVNEKNSKYYLNGRVDDLIISKTGENLNPEIIESALEIENADKIALIKVNNEPVLLISSAKCNSLEKFNELKNNAKQQLLKNNLHNEIYQILITNEKLIQGEEFKISRTKLANKVKSGEIFIIEENVLEKRINQVLTELEKEIAEMFKKALATKPKGVFKNSNFFTDLGGTSLEYFLLADKIKSQYSIDITNIEGQSLYTIDEICEKINKI